MISNSPGDYTIPHIDFILASYKPHSGTPEVQQGILPTKTQGVSYGAGASMLIPLFKTKKNTVDKMKDLIKRCSYS